MKRTKLAGFTAGVAALALVIAACGGSGGSGTLQDLTGKVDVDGSSTVFLISQAVAEEFRNEAPDVKVTIGESGTGGGFKKFCSDNASERTDISDASRTIKDEEKAQCTKNGIEYVELTIALDGLSIVTHPSNTFVDCLTKDELKRIWAPNSKINNWKDVRAGFPDKPLKLYGPGTASGTFDYFTKEIVGEEGSSRSDYTPNEDDNILVRGIADDSGSLGYFGFGYYEQNTDKLRLLGVDSGSGCLKPSKDLIQGGTYKPLSRPLFIYIAKGSIARKEVKAFVNFYLDNVNVLVADVGYVALQSGDFTATEQAWASAAPSTPAG
jgi:phosphate transport system substrate-binding protein